MKDFKFFQKGTVEDPQMLDESTFITASFNDDTPEGHMGRRRLYHTDRNLYERLRHPNDPERFSQTTSVTTVKETFWTKFKDVMRESWRAEPVGVVVASVLTTLIVIVGIAKLLGL
jgi:hypothetical protein